MGQVSLYEVKNLTDAEQIKNDLKELVDPEKAEFLPKFFKTLPGGYAEGDQFIGVAVPEQRKIAKNYYKNVSLDELQKLICDPVHEYRQTALFILACQFEKAGSEREKKLVDFYMNNLAYINNWDLVDSSAHKILGAYLFDKEKDLLYKLARSENLWQQRIAIISTFSFIKKNHFQDALAITQILLHHQHDLIHKAVGWMLREIGNRDFATEYGFLKEHYREMPRTMLRYAIEKFEPELREKFLKGLI
jgi:3-methyladenine DNA glycosylase AlkD